MRTVSPKLVLALLGSLTLTLATTAHLRALRRSDASASDDGAFKKLLGDGRRLFAGQFVELADVYLHSGFYPSIFDRRETTAPKAVTGKTGKTDDHDQEGHQHDEQGKCIHSDEPADEHEKAMSFMGTPTDWLDAFIRRFRITKHSHLEDGEEREVLPWLKLAIELDPQAIETYTSTAYWLRKKLGKADDAEAVLREGVRNNPSSCEILFELGLLYQESHNDPGRARNLWLLALRRWNEQSPEAKTAGAKSLGEITANLARLERDAGNWQRAIQYFELARTVSPAPAAIQKQIEEIQLQHGEPTNSLPDLVPAP